MTDKRVFYDSNNRHEHLLDSDDGNDCEQTAHHKYIYIISKRYV